MYTVASLRVVRARLKCVLIYLASLRVVRARLKCVLIYCNIIESGQRKSKVCSFIL